MAVLPLEHKIRMFTETGPRPVLEHKPAVLLKTSAAEYRLHQCMILRVIIRGVGEDERRLPGGIPHEFFGIRLLDRYIFEAQRHHGFFYETYTTSVCIHSHDMAGTAREQLARHRTDAAKQVDGRDPLQVQPAAQEVEQAGTREVGRGPHPLYLRGTDDPAPMAAADYTHRCWLNREKQVWYSTRLLIADVL